MLRTDCLSMFTWNWTYKSKVRNKNKICILEKVIRDSLRTKPHFLHISLVIYEFCMWKVTNISRHKMFLVVWHGRGSEAFSPDSKLTCSHLAADVELLGHVIVLGWWALQRTGGGWRPSAGWRRVLQPISS